MSSEVLCQFCNIEQSKYNCPRCNLVYCSVTCYKSPNHLKCSEAFYKDCVVEELALQREPKNVPGSCNDAKQMYEILKRIENLEPNIGADFDLSDDDNDELDSDDEDDEDDEMPDDNDLSKRLEGIDLNDANAIWSHLTEAERREFNQIVQSEDVTSILPKFNAWWEKQIEIKLVTEMNDNQNYEQKEKSVEHPKIVQSIVDFKRISTKSPAPCVVNNLVNVLASYASMVRFFYGEYETSKNEAINYLVAICGNLRTNANFDDSELAIESVRQNGLNEGYSIDESDIRQIGKDVDHLMKGPYQNQHCNIYALAALSDLHRLFTAVKVEMKSIKTKPIDLDQATEVTTISNEQSKSSFNETETFSKRFNDHKVEQRLGKGQITSIIKKIEYYLAYVKNYH